MSPNPDPVGDLLREEGLMTPPEGFTDRIMQRISVEPAVTKSFTPLLSSRTWMLVFGSAILIVLTCLAVLPATESPSLVFGNIEVPEALRLNLYLTLSPTLSASLKLGTLILDAIVLLLLFDQTLQKRFTLQ